MFGDTQHQVQPTLEMPVGLTNMHTALGLQHGYSPPGFRYDRSLDSVGEEAEVVK